MNEVSKKQRYGTWLGIFFLVVGIPGLVLPFVQGILFIALGLALLSTFSPRAGRIIGAWKSKSPQLALHLDRAENRIAAWFRKPTHTFRKLKIDGNNRRKLSVIVEEAKEPPRGTVILMHGLGGYKEQPLMRALADAFGDMQFSVVRFDAANSVGESSGTYALGTATSFLNDLVSVVDWLEGQGARGNGPLWLAGHSLGGLCVFEYAMQFPSRISGVVTYGSVISGTHSQEAYVQYRKDEWEEWRQKGFREDRVPVRGVRNRLPFSHFEDRLHYDLTRHADTFATPTLMMVGENDQHTPVSHQQDVYVRLKGQKRLNVLPGASHTPTGHADLDAIKTCVKEFIGAQLPLTE